MISAVREGCWTPTSVPRSVGILPGKTSRTIWMRCASGTLVQEEVDERALQLCTFAFVYGESGTGNLNAQVKVYPVIFLGQFPVAILYSLIIIRLQN